MTTPKWDIPISVKIAPSTVDDPDASVISGMFGLSGQRVEPLYEDFRLSISPGEIITVTGPSGGGKTSLLRAVAESVPDAITLDLDALSAESKPAIACLTRSPVIATLRSSDSSLRSTSRMDGLGNKLAVLSRCGLADAKALITSAKFLSGGQLYRLALASAVWRAFVSGKPRLMLIDEFASTLDAITAAVLAAGMRKLTRRYGLAMIISTPRYELLEIIKPDRTIVKGLGEPARTIGHSALGIGHSWSWDVQRRAVISGGFAERRTEAETTTRTAVPPMPNAQCLMPAACWRITPGTIKDYRALSRFHYLTGPPAAHKRVWTIRAPVDAKHPGTPEVAAVLVVSPPVLCCRGRNVATGKRYVSPDRRASTYLLNAEIECISRVVVHPIYRSCGLAVRLVRHALRTTQTPLIEALATMGAIHPFFERGGMSAFGRFKGRKLNYNYYLATANAVLPRNSFNPDTI